MGERLLWKLWVDEKNINFRSRFPKKKEKNLGGKKNFLKRKFLYLNVNSDNDKIYKFQKVVIKNCIFHP